MGLYETVELYNEFLNHIESSLFYDNVIDVSTSGTPTNSPKESPPHCTSTSQRPLNSPSSLGSLGSVNLNLDLDINQYYDQLAQPFNDPLALLKSLYDQNYKPPVNHASFIGLYPKPPLQLPELEQKQDDDEVDDDDEDLCPGLFPHMDVNDTHQFMTFDMLPLNPSYVDHS